MKGYIDMHCHILPGIDDGAKDLDKTRQMLQRAYREGIRTIVATPHHHEDEKRGKPSIEQIAGAFSKVNHLIDEAFPEMTILPGMEIYYTSQAVRDYKAGKLLYMGASEFVLLEFSPFDTAMRITDGVKTFQMMGAGVIIAHAERYEALRKDIDAVRHLKNMGARIQVNASSLEKGRLSTLGRVLRAWMDEDLIDFVGTDAHDDSVRPPVIKKALGKVEKTFGRAYAREIFLENAKEILFP